MNLKPKTYNLKAGFTLIELLIVVFIVASLTAIVTVNFSQQRNQQELLAAAQSMVSKIREVQNFVNTGRQVSGGQAADAYEITINQGSQSYSVHYFVNSNKTLLETITLPQNISISQIRVNNNPRGQVVIRMEAPFGKILAGGTPNQIVQITPSHSQGSQTRTVVIDGISGKIGVE